MLKNMYDIDLEVDERYIRMAHVWAENSYAKRLKVGCLIVKNRTIISDGYNGTPSGFPNVCETAQCNKEQCECKQYAEDSKERLECNAATLRTKPEVLHAESNAITKIARSGNSSEGATLYVTDTPCLECAKLIIQAGIVRVVYDRPYRDRSGIELLLRANVSVERILITH